MEPQIARPLLPPPALGKGCHGCLSCRGIAVCRRATFMDAKRRVPTGAALGLEMRPTTAPFSRARRNRPRCAPDGPHADARLRISEDMAQASHRLGWIERLPAVRYPPTGNLHCPAALTGASN